MEVRRPSSMRAHLMEPAILALTLNVAVFVSSHLFDVLPSNAFVHAIHGRHALWIGAQLDGAFIVGRAPLMRRPSARDPERCTKDEGHNLSIM